MLTGPAGVMCAYNLAQAGVSVRIIERRPERLLKGQADVIQVRGLEILDAS
jgi:phenol 2-monooxygenase